MLKNVSPTIYIFHPSRDHSGWLNRRMKVYGSDESRTPTAGVKIQDSDHCTIHSHTTKSKSFNIILLPEYNSLDQLLLFMFIYRNMLQHKRE